MLWLVCFSLFSVVSSFPFGIHGRNELQNYQVQVVEHKGLPYQRHSICLPSPFLRQICLPSALQFFIPLQTVETGRQRCLTIPIMRTYVIKVCPPTGTIPQIENSDKSFKEVVTEEEKEPLSDNNINIQVNGEEIKSKDNEETSDETKELQLEVKNIENNIIRDLDETNNEENELLERLLTNNSLDDENISITSNLV